MMAPEGENSKHEIRNSKQSRSTKSRMADRTHLVVNVIVSCFEFVSDFGFRISCLMLMVLLIHFPKLCADDSYAQNVARLEKMTADQKEELRRKKLRFDGLNSDEQQRLRDLHEEITSDANSKE